MAYKDMVFYNVDSAVGRGMPNRREDVMLVQFFLKELLNHPTLRSHRPAGPDMVIDGLFGPQTDTWIRTFQQLVTSRGLKCVVDGKVNRAPPDWDARLPNRTPFTITHMNGGYRTRFRTDHDYLDRCPRLPAALRPALADSK